jgi:hypothetical protein
MLFRNKHYRGVTIYSSLLKIITELKEYPNNIIAIYIRFYISLNSQIKR